MRICGVEFLINPSLAKTLAKLELPLSGRFSDRRPSHFGKEETEKNRKNSFLFFEKNGKNIVLKC